MAKARNQQPPRLGDASIQKPDQPTTSLKANRRTLARLNEAAGAADTARGWSWQQLAGGGGILGHKEVPVTHLGRMMLEELQRRSYAQSTVKGYLLRSK